MSELFFDTPTGEVIVGVGAAALHINPHAGDSLAYLETVTSSTLDLSKRKLPDIEAEVDASAVPLHALIAHKEFPYVIGDYPELDTKNWGRDAYIRYGRWAVQVMAAAPEAQARVTSRLTRDQLKRLRVLGLGPRYEKIGEEFKTLSNYRQEIGIHPGRLNGQYANWSRQNYAKYGAKLAQRLGRKPTINDYIAAYRDPKYKGPGPGVIEVRVGGIRDLNDMIGYPDITKWDTDDYVDWGMRVSKVNPGRELTTSLISVLSRRKRGPSIHPIYQHFDSFPSFQKEVADGIMFQAEDEADAVNRWLAAYDKLVSNKILPVPETKLSGYDKAIIAMRHRIAVNCLPNTKNETLATIAAHTSLIGNIRRASKYSVDAGQVEMIASSLGVFDFIWPPYIPTKEFYVSDEELAQEQAKYRRYKQRQRCSRA